MENYGEIRRVLVYVLFLNLLVAALKFIFGSLAGSVSMVADSFHSFFDSTSNIIGLIAINVASKPPDRDHPYGHRKYENFATMGIAALIFFACIEILQGAWSRLSSGGYSSINIQPATVVVMAATIAINYMVSAYERRKGVELHSPFLEADAMHTKIDIYISISVLVGFIVINAGYPVFDPLGAVVIAILIVKMGYEIIKQSSTVLCDVSMLDENSVREVVQKVQGVENCHNVRTRGGEDNIHLDLHIWVDSKLPIDKAHDISHSVEHEIKKAFKGVRDVVVHIEPDRTTR
jgi:cation diffusion facilitator family transporter